MISFNDLINDPYTHYEKLRQGKKVVPIELSTINRKGNSKGTMLMVFDYETTRFVLSDDRFGRDSDQINRIFKEKGWENQVDFDQSKSLDKHILNMDAPDHTRIRKLAMKAFTPKVINALEPRIVEVSNKIVENIKAQMLNGQTVIEAVENIGYPLPITMICEILGIPEGQGRDDFKKWSNILLSRPDVKDKTVDLDKAFDDIVNSAANTYDKLLEIITEKRESLKTREPKDLMDEMILATENEEKLTDRELLSMSFILLIAGHETTVNLISTSLVKLCQDQELQETLRNNPDKTIKFIEEIMRQDGPVHFASIRFTKEPVEIEGIKIDKDELIMVSLHGANTDPKHYDDPERLDINREKASHIGFGHGIHFCLGAALARSEGVIVVNTILKNFPKITLDVPVETLPFKPSGGIRGRSYVPVTFYENTLVKQ